MKNLVELDVEDRINLKKDLKVAVCNYVDWIQVLRISGFSDFVHSPVF
jgi:hypothetical protein